MTYTFPAQVAWSAASNAAVKNVSFQVYAVTDTTYTTPLAILDANGVAIPGNILSSGTIGVFPQFQQASNATVVITDAAHVYAWTLNCIPSDASTAAFINAAGSATQTALSATYVSKGTEFISVKDYGAKGDGTTDDATAIQNAINASTAKGTAVLFPPGVYIVGSPLLVTTNGVSLIGAARASTDSNLGSVIKAKTGFTGAQIIMVSQTGTPTAPLNGITISHLTINGNGHTGTAVDGIYFQAYNSLIFDCEVGYCSGNGINVTGLAAWHTYNTVVSHTLTHDNSGDGLHFGVGSHDTTEIGCHSFSNAGHGSYVSKAGHVIDACHHYGNTLNGVMLDGPANSAQLIGSEFEYNHKAGVYLHDDGTYAPQAVQIIGCNFYGNSYLNVNLYDNLTIGESATHGAQALVIGNHFGAAPNTPRYGVNLASSNAQRVIVEGNIFDGVYGTAKVNALGSTASGLASVFRDNAGLNPIGSQTVSVPASTTVLQNPTNYDCTVYIAGGTVTVIAIAGTTTGLISGTFRVPAGQSITLTYTTAPTWVWIGD